MRFPTRDLTPRRAVLCMAVAFLVLLTVAVVCMGVAGDMPGADRVPATTVACDTRCPGAGSLAQVPPCDTDMGQGERVPLPPSLRAAVQSAMERDAYEIQQAGLHSLMPGSHRAVNRAQKLRFGFSGNGVHVRPEDGTADWELNMSLCGIGYGDIMQTVGEGRLEAAGNRVESRRVTATGKSFTEWYVHTPRGLEQGFTLPERPGATRNPEDPLLVEFIVSGNVRPSLSEDGRSIGFATADGKVAVRYRDLHAFDARGLELRSHLVVGAGRVALAVDDAAATYPLTIDPLFTTEIKLTPSDASSEYKGFGRSLTIDGDTALVGAHFDDNRGGAVYVFVRSGTTWCEQAKLTVERVSQFQDFGTSVALSGDTALIGSPNERVFSGAVYVFVRSGTTWTQQAKLTAGDVFFNSFGFSVALNGNTALVGAPQDNDKGTHSGAAYVFEGSGSTWSTPVKLKANDAEANDRFGWSVALSGDTALLGADRFHESLDVRLGSAYVFVRSGTTWCQQAKLVDGGGAVRDRFGKSVALSGDTAIVGSPRSDGTVGSAHVFVRSGQNWSPLTELTANDPGVFLFGWSVALDGNTALIGATHDQVALGQAYVFVRSGTGWSLATKLTASVRALGDRFGFAVALNGATALVGTIQDVAYVYESDPATLLQILIEQVKAINTTNSIANTSLEAKLDAAVQALEDLNNNNDVAAIKALNAFISAVQAQSGKTISTAEANALIAAAQQIIDLIEGS